MILISIPILGISLSLVRGRSFIVIFHITFWFDGSSGNNFELIIFLVFEFSSTLLLCNLNMCLLFCFFIANC
jgi:hypothetical protein